jgi:hypothetical protein
MEGDLLGFDFLDHRADCGDCLWISHLRKQALQVVDPSI